MRLQRKEFHDALKLVGTVVSGRALKPILANVLLTYENGTLTLGGTDLETRVMVRVKYEGDDKGAAVLPCARLAQIVGRLKCCEVRLVVGEDRKAVLNGAFTMHGEDPAEFPGLAAKDGAKTITVSCATFRDMMRRTAFAAAKERSRFAFNGVRFQVDGDTFRLIATDGKRMALLGTPCAKIGAVGQIVPNGTMKVLAKAVGKHGAVRIGFHEAETTFATGAVEVSGRNVEGAFPRYENVIPKTTDLAVEVVREALADALTQAQVFTNEEARSVRFGFADGAMVLKSRCMDIGEAEIAVPVTTTGATFDVAFNPSFMLEGLKVTEAARVTLRVSGKDTPLLLEGDEGYTYVLMPVTVRS